MENKKKALDKRTSKARADTERQTMKDYKAKVISFQSLRKFPENFTEIDFSIPIKPPMREKLDLIAQAEGVDPVCLGALALVHLINQKWNWLENRPKQKQGDRSKGTVRTLDDKSPKRTQKQTLPSRTKETIQISNQIFKSTKKEVMQNELVFI